MPAALTPQTFVAKWRKATLKESAAANEHFLDLCQLADHPTPAMADAEGTSFTFEYGAAKLGGGQGFADVFKRGCFGWEYKGKHANLDKAYQQLLQYREALHNPPLLVVSDIDTIVVHPNFVNRANRPTTITLDDLLTPAGMAALRAIFTDPQHFESPETPESVTQRIAADFARIADRLRASGAESPRIAHFLIRLLFCLFAEDVELLPRGLFARLIERTHYQPAAFAAQLRQLFAVMAAGGWFGVERIPHFNGGLFDDDTALELDGESMDVLARVAGADWGAIEPSIFGTLFERSLDPDKRSQLGAHYTSKEDILLIVEPVLMAPLRRRWAEIKAEAEALAAKRDLVGAGLVPAQGDHKGSPLPPTRLQKAKQRANLDRKLQDLCRDFAAELAAVTVLDPACGSGNFLYLALRSLLDLWKEVYSLMLALGLTPVSPLEGISPTPAQLHGIEINPYAHELAQATIWIGYIQWLRDHGFGSPSEPILRPIQTVQRMDAIIDLTGFEDAPIAEGAASKPVRSREPEWPAADVIIGNPPFLGDRKMRRELGDAYVDALRKLYEDRLPGGSDLVCYWLEKARAMIEAGRTQRAGLLATQGIRGGANRAVLERVKRSGDIFWAESDRAWILDGATVHVSMIGFDTGEETERRLDGREVAIINSDLSTTVDLTQAVHLIENKRLSFIGTQKSGPFDLTKSQAEAMLSAVGNPNKKQNSDVVKPWINAIDVTQHLRNMWIIDFGPNMSLEEAALYEAPFEYVKRHVKPIRDIVRRPAHKKKWWLFGDTRPGMREAISGLTRYIATPMVSKHRVFVWQPISVVPENLLVVIARDDDYFLGVLSARPHELWARRKGTQLREAESGGRYTPTSTFETFPFPWPPGQEPADDPRMQAISQAAQELVQLRDAWLNPPDLTGLGDLSGLRARTLTNLYNARPTWLDNAHRKLDAAVFAAYGWPALLSDEEILERLLALNLARAGSK